MSRKKREDSKDSLLKEILDYVVTIAVVVGLMLLLQNFVIINAQIPSASMETTVMTGDRIFGNRLAYLKSDPKRFDIVIFRFPDDESKLYIKRIIGLPGETVDVVDGKVYINGSQEPLDDSFCRETPNGDYDGHWVVDDNGYFMMGDNRNDSWDSRCWVHTFVQRDKILGKALLRYWPFTKIKMF
ncbi:MAG: signal peptidase I [Lachnospiraceae bacterium]|nr:signal peptidase I [Lachnospiraceae bacterium]